MSKSSGKILAYKNTSVLKRGGVYPLCATDLNQYKTPPFQPFVHAMFTNRKKITRDSAKTSFIAPT